MNHRSKLPAQTVVALPYSLHRAAGAVVTPLPPRVTPHHRASTGPRFSHHRISFRLRPQVTSPTTVFKPDSSRSLLRVTVDLGRLRLRRRFVPRRFPICSCAQSSQTRPAIGYACWLRRVVYLCCCPAGLRPQRRHGPPRSPPRLYAGLRRSLLLLAASFHFRAAASP